MQRKTIGTDDRKPAARWRSLNLAWLALALVLLFTAAVRTRLLDVPLERDEGEYAYIGQLILQGVPPYTSAYTMKLPGTALAYAFFMGLFGQTSQGVHLGLLVVNCVSIVLVFLIGKRMFGEISGAVSAAVFALLSLNHSVLGFAAHATHFVVLTGLAGTLMLLVALDKDTALHYLAAGVLFGFAPVMKQPGAFYTLFGVLYLLYHHRISRSAPPWKSIFRPLSLFVSGALIPLLLVVLWCAWSGVFDRLWFWTITYAREYAAMVPWSVVGSRLIDRSAAVADGFALLWCMAAAGLAVAVAGPRRREQRAFLVLLFISGFLALCPGLYFRHHYFITVLPAAALAAGYFVSLLWEKGAAPLRYAAAALFAIALGSGLFLERAYFFETSPTALSRRFFSHNPFPESIVIADFIRSNSSEGDRIAVFGSEPQIYFYANRRSATGHLYMYGMMEDHPYNRAMQAEMIREVEAGRPRFIVFTPISGSWLTTPKSDRSLITWLSEYQNKHYSLVGVADIVSDSETIYKWHDEARAYIFQTPRRIYVLERTSHEKG